MSAPENADRLAATLTTTHPPREVHQVPVVSIRRGSSWTLNLRELFAYRELLYFLIWRDIKIRYKQTVLGAAWAIIQPLFAMAIFTVIFGRLASMPSDGIPYPLFAYAGLVPWTFISNAVAAAGSSVVASSNLVTKVYFPRLIIPAGSVGVALVDFGIAFVTLAALAAYYRVAPTALLLMLPLLIIVTICLALGMGIFISAVTVKYRDVRHALPFAIQLWLFASPVIYPSSIVPQKWRWLFALNPLAGLLEGYRSALFGRHPDWSLIGSAVVLTIAIFALSIYVFRRLEKSFADLV